MVEKTYREKNIKYLLSLVFLLFLSVIILLYLLSIGNFLPKNPSGEYSVLNISVFSILSLLATFSFLSLTFYTFFGVILKKNYAEVISSKISILITIGIFLVLILNFFHILDMYWGLGILLVLIIISFVI